MKLRAIVFLIMADSIFVSCKSAGHSSKVEAANDDDRFSLIYGTTTRTAASGEALVMKVTETGTMHQGHTYKLKFITPGIVPNDWVNKQVVVVGKLSTPDADTLDVTYINWFIASNNKGEEPSVNLIKILAKNNLGRKYGGYEISNITCRYQGTPSEAQIRSGTNPTCQFVDNSNGKSITVNGIDAKNMFFDIVYFGGYQTPSAQIPYKAFLEKVGCDVYHILPYSGNCK